jgi:hypothetical protein
VSIYFATKSTGIFLKKYSGAFLVKPIIFTTIISEKSATIDIQLSLSVVKALKEKGVTSSACGKCPAMASHARPDTVLDNLYIRSPN